MKKRVAVSWSGGKDSAFALYKILTNPEYEVDSIHTVFDSESRRVGMHGIRESVIEAQAETIGLRLEKLYMDASESHDAYTTLMANYYRTLKVRGVDAIVFGDIFLEDLKKFRDDLLVDAGLSGIYPLWKIDSDILIHDFINLGFKTLVCAANGKYFSKAALGRTIDEKFLADLPIGVDPCGENGEFHTFVYDGPVFAEPVRVKTIEVVARDYKFKFVDDGGDIHETVTPFLFCEVTIP